MELGYNKTNSDQFALYRLYRKLPDDKEVIKCKKKVWNDPSKWVTFENTQEAIIDKQTYDAVQKIREGRRRPAPMGEMNVFSGMVYCADCGKKMYLCRCSTTKQKEYFNCSSYRKQKKSTCTSH